MNLDLFEIGNWAKDQHRNVNQRYGENNDLPYAYHLDMVRNVSNIAWTHLPINMHDIMFAACYCHDLIEDARLTYNDVAKVTGAEVADIVYALTQEKGKTRHERQSDKYYEGIRNTPIATYVKLCDRIANTTYAKSERSRMFDIYKNEYDNFKIKLYDATDNACAILWRHLDNLYES